MSKFIKLDIRVTKAKSLIKELYLNDPRHLCIAYSGGKDSTAIVYLVCSVLKE